MLFLQHCKELSVDFFICLCSLKHIVKFLFSLNFRLKYNNSFVYNKNLIASLCHHNVRWYPKQVNISKILLYFWIWIAHCIVYPQYKISLYYAPKKHTIQIIFTEEMLLTVITFIWVIVFTIHMHCKGVSTLKTFVTVFTVFTFNISQYISVSY